jgi:hypothetical protein
MNADVADKELLNTDKIIKKISVYLCNLRQKTKIFFLFIFNPFFQNYRRNKQR